MSEFAKDSLTLEETNRLRISLGLKPLSNDSTANSKAKGAQSGEETEPVKDNDQIAEDNYRAKREAASRQKEDEEIRAKIAKARNQRDLRRQLRGPTLGEIDSTEASTSVTEPKSTAKWLKQAQKRAKENAARRARDEEEQEAAVRATYGENDLVGLRVAHDVDDFELQAGEEGKVLTLRDSRILDVGEDELMDAQLEQRELDRINDERRKGPRQYTGIEDDEIDPSHLRRQKGVLSKYDADIPGSDIREHDGGGFRLGGPVETSEEKRESKRRELEEEARLRNRTLLDLDYTKNQEVSDYLAPGDVGFKKAKAKKKKRLTTSRIQLDDRGGEDGEGFEDVEMAQPVQHLRRQAEERDNLIDDDELAASLAKARRAKAKKTASKITPEEIARTLAAQREVEERGSTEPNGGEASNSRLPDGQAGNTATDVLQASEGGLIFDETSEFIRNVGQKQEQEPVVRRAKQEPTGPILTAGVSIKEEPQDLYLGGSVDIDGLLSGGYDEDGAVKDEVMEEDGFPTVPRRGHSSSVSPPVNIGTSAEPIVSGGVAGTLNLLRSQGLLDAVSPAQREREAAQREYDLWKARRLAEQAVQEEERRINKLQGSAKDQATREHENKLRELEDARRAEARFRDYKPDVDIKYHDQYGRVLDKHEAWKLLSHTFHGKAPGKAKQEKYKQKVMDERKRERMAAGEAQDMSKAFRERQQREGQAHMVLSVGAKGNAPQDFANHLGPNLVQARNAAASGSGSRASKIKGGLHPSSGEATDGRGGSQERGGILSVMSESFSPLPTSSSTPLPPNGPRMRPAFQPLAPPSAPANGTHVGSGAGEVGSTSATSNGLALGSGFKLAFGSSSSAGDGKRKADDQNGR